VTKSNSTIAEFISFLASPKEFFNKQNSQKPYQRLFFVLKIVSFSLLLGILINYFSSYVSSLVGFNQTDNNIVSRDLKAFTPIIGLLLVTVIGPLLEELAFRLYLTTQRTYFFFGLNFFAYYIWEFIGGIFNLKNTFVFNSPGIFFVIIFIFTVNLVLSLTVSAKWLSQTVTKYFGYFVYSSGIIFGLIHITNYENYQKYFYLIPILVLPQVAVSFIFAFVRTKFSFWWGVISHTLYNFALASPMFALAIFVGNDRSQEIEDLLGNKNLGNTVSAINPTEKLILSGINWFILSMYLLLSLVLVYAVYELVVGYKKLSSKR
jgi:membrane protease YdiL (CAAX protease family)